ncbi:MAG: S26 family signal peptidase [Bacteroidales bacterium]|jgi:type IV secretory pathway protease TraF|nr:S26 family signal peptidase [Bacteroidales bacterium]
MYCFSIHFLPESYFVPGDNRNNSMDSRYHGWVKKEQVTGKVSTILLPNNKNRMDRAQLFQTIR